VNAIHPVLMQALRSSREERERAAKQQADDGAREVSGAVVSDALVSGIKDRDAQIASHKARIVELEAQLGRVQADLAGAAERAQSASTGLAEASAAAKASKEEAVAHRFRSGQLRIDLHTEREAKVRAEAALAEMEKRLVATEQRLEKATGDLMVAIQSIPQPAPMVMPELPAPPKHWTVKVAGRDAAGVVRSLKITPSED
jgi:chromosome segregation ATPase